MSIARQWLRQPQSVRFRKALFQVHLWIGLGTGLYIVALCLTGSVLVYREPLSELFETPLPAYQAGRESLSRVELTAAAEQAYPGFDVVRVGERFTRRRPVIEIWLERGAERRERLFNPYTGEDVGDAIPPGLRAVLWMADLHNELLFGDTGKRVNGVGSILVSMLAFTGIVLWWPGALHWRRGLGVKWSARWPRFNWDLHSAVGFWFFPLLALWGLTGIYLAFPEPFSAFVDRVSDPNAILGQRPGDIVLRWLVRLHFGRWEEAPPLMAVWALFGAAPVVMLVTGVAMWWVRVLRKGWRRPDDDAEAAT
jgi:uncharacterized iron-regulated membrane protein